MKISEENSSDSCIGEIINIHHITLWVTNAQQFSTYFCYIYGFKPLAYYSDENVCKYVVKQNNIVFVFISSITTKNNQVNEFLRDNCDQVKDIAFVVNDLDEYCRKHSITSFVKEPWEEKDSNGIVKSAVIKGIGNCVHTLVERTNYNGSFLPNYLLPIESYPLLDSLPPANITSIDHFVNLLKDSDEEKALCLQYYEQLGFQRLPKSVHIKTTDIDLNVITYVSYNKKLFVNITSPIENDLKSHLRKFIENNNNNSGVQHIAFETEDIITTVRNLKKRGAFFLNVPPSYYDHVERSIKSYNVQLREDIKDLKELGILFDCDKKGYLLQIFCKSFFDKSTTYFEFIQRYNFSGFGSVNVKHLYEAMEDFVNSTTNR